MKAIANEPEEQPDRVTLTEPVTTGGFWRVVLHYPSGGIYDSLFRDEGAARRFVAHWKDLRHV